jgi:hypothetical protein
VAVIDRPGHQLQRVGGYIYTWSLLKGLPTVEEGPGGEGDLVCLVLQGLHNLQQQHSGVRAQAAAATSP